MGNQVYQLFCRYIWFVLAEKFQARVYVNQEKSLFDLHTLIKH